MRQLPIGALRYKSEVLRLWGCISVLCWFDSEVVFTSRHLSPPFPERNMFRRNGWSCKQLTLPFLAAGRTCRTRGTTTALLLAGAPVPLQWGVTKQRAWIPVSCQVGVKWGCLSYVIAPREPLETFWRRVNSHGVSIQIAVEFCS